MRASTGWSVLQCSGIPHHLCKTEVLQRVSCYGGVLVLLCGSPPLLSLARRRHALGGYFLRRSHHRCCREFIIATAKPAVQVKARFTTHIGHSD